MYIMGFSVFMFSCTGRGIVIGRYPVQGLLLIFCQQGSGTRKAGSLGTPWSIRSYKKICSNNSSYKYTAKRLNTQMGWATISFREGCRAERRHLTLEIIGIKVTLFHTYLQQITVEWMVKVSVTSRQMHKRMARKILLLCLHVIFRLTKFNSIKEYSTYCNINHFPAPETKQSGYPGYPGSYRV